MRLAGEIGLNVPRCFIWDHAEHPLYIVERYDRGKGGERIHQQDFCQAQGFLSEEKYENRGGPNLGDNYQLIKKYITITKRTKTLFCYLDWICFNLLIGNNDSHSKNLSLLLKNGKVELAPFYDLLSTAIYPKLRQNFSFMLGDRDDALQIGPNQLEMVDVQLGLKKGTMGQRVAIVSEKLIKSKDKLEQEIRAEFPKAKIVKRISSLIEKRYKNLKRQGL